MRRFGMMATEAEPADREGARRRRPWDSGMVEPRQMATGTNALEPLDRLLLGIYTAQCRRGDGLGIEPILPAERTTFFGYGRQALAEGLVRVGVGPGDVVLLPAFICREVLASLAAVGAVPRLYAVDARLCTSAEALDWAGHDGAGAVVAVNYFGFPQPLGPFRQWCGLHNVPLIEDNAHGFLSADGAVPLGRRGDLGIFSLRKTLTLPNGAALVDNRESPSGRSMMAFTGSCRTAVLKYRAKIGLKQVMKWGTLRTARGILAAIRGVRLLATGSAIPASTDDGKTVPQEGFASLSARVLRRCDATAEGRRRQALYRRCGELFQSVGEVEPLFATLSDGVCPQGFPFLFKGSDAAAFMAHWMQRGVPILPWPDHLPDSVLADAPVHYRRVMLVPFLW